MIPWTKVWTLTDMVGFYLFIVFGLPGGERFFFWSSELVMDIEACCR